MKYYLVTGVSTGIGFSIVRLFVEQGLFVFGSVRRKEEGDRLKKQFGDNFHPLVFDVTDSEAVKAAAREVESLLDGQLLSGLVNNAGIVVSGPMMNIPVEDFRLQMEVNVLGVLQVSQAFLPLLGARLPAVEAAGRIVNISSVSGRIAGPFVGPYAASKHALEAMTHALRRELTIYGIKVISIQPGPVKTPIWEKATQSVNLFPGTDYEPFLKVLEKSIRKTEKSAIPAARVAEKVLQALQSRRPRLSYVVAANPLKYRFIYSLVPERLIDWFIKRGFNRVMSR